jgi:hypothetical protein
MDAARLSAIAERMNLDGVAVDIDKGTRFNQVEVGDTADFIAQLRASGYQGGDAVLTYVPSRAQSHVYFLFDIDRYTMLAVDRARYP